MQDQEYLKKCNAGELTKELIAAGFTQHNPDDPEADFDFYGVSTNGDTTIVHLSDTTAKDPTDTVNAHIYTEPPPL